MRLENRPSIHRFSQDHEHGQPCKIPFGIKVCDNEEHVMSVTREHPLGLSWRKLLAYTLWRNGTFRTPLETQRWVTAPARHKLVALPKWPRISPDQVAKWGKIILPAQW